MSITEYAKLQENNLDLIQEIYSEYNDLLNMRNDMAEHGYDTEDVDAMIKFIKAGLDNSGIDFE